MRKISIISQIVLLFLIVVLIAVSAFSLLTLSRVRIVAEEETFTRLLAYSNILESDIPTISAPNDFGDMEIAFIVGKNNEITYSEDLTDYLSKEDLKRVYEKIINNNNNLFKFSYANKIHNHNNELIYFAYTTTDGGNSFNLLVTSSSYVTNLVNDVSLQMILLFSTIIILAVLAIATWSIKFVGRIHHIQDQILAIPNSYVEPESVDFADEIGDLSRFVEQMRVQIVESENVKREMLQNISHDFKTPIAVIKSYAEAQQDGMTDEESSKIIITQAEILKNKVNRLLQYNSLEYLKKDKEFEDVDMNSVINDVITGYKFQTNLEIELDLKEDIYFKGYRENFTTVVDNIIDNARRYAKTKIKVVLRKDRLRIYNDGEHIDEQFLNGVFKPYEKGSKGEFGLGMSIVKKTVEFFGMKLIVKNEQIGVSFIITK